MSWRGRVVLVTGAGGFIGSHLAERLVELGASVRAFVHYNALNSYGWLDSSQKRPEMQIFAGDICDRDSVRNAMEGVETVFHLAALIAIPYSYSAPVSYIKTNIEGTLNVLQSAREFRVARVLHTSTSEVYGSARYVPIDEAHPLQGQSPYSASKIGADKIAESFYLSFGVPVVTVRPFNTFGPRQSSRAVIPTIMTQCLSGNVVRLGNLHPKRDLNFISNTVEGYVAAANSAAGLGETVNFGSGREIAIGDLAQLISRILGCEVPIEEEIGRFRPERSEVDRLLADNTKAHELFGWKPKVSLEEGLAHTAEWIQSNLEHYRTGVYVL